jgi:hypothetical protein
MSFSKRFGYRATPDGDLIREDAPEGVRAGFLDIFEKKLGPNGLRDDVVCKVLRKRPDPGNWSEYPNVWGEVQELVHEAPWYKVYDMIEEALASLPASHMYPDISGMTYSTPPKRAAAINELNELFQDETLAWRVTADGQIVLHSSDANDATRARALETLEAAGRQTARHELREAINALSRRPKPDERDAVRRALGAMEAVARDITGDRKATLGEILKKHPDLLPPALREGFSKVWGYSSDVARHVDETRAPTLKEAELVVGLVAAAVTYLGGSGKH